MKSAALVLCLIFPLAAGCVTPALERHAVNQIQTVADFRYEAALHCLAMVADNQGTLPSYALLSSGLSSVSDTGIANAATNATFNPAVFKSEVLGFTGAHAPNLTWTVSPVADFTQLAAMRCVCQWVLAGPDHPDPDRIPILADPEIDPYPGPHFGVSRRLKRLPPDWLHVVRGCEAPECACCKARCGSTSVWVTPEGMGGLAEFTLVLQDIATQNVEPLDGTTVPANQAPPIIVTLWVYQMPAVPITISRGGTPTSATVAAGQAVAFQSGDNQEHKVFYTRDKNKISGKYDDVHAGMPTFRVVDQDLILGALTKGSTAEA
jgi:hypothetical protein